MATDMAVVVDIDVELELELDEPVAAREVNTRLPPPPYHTHEAREDQPEGEVGCHR